MRMWIVRKYVAYLVFDKDDPEEDQSETFAFEPFSNKVHPAIFESQEYSKQPYRAALEKARELNKRNSE